MKKIGIIILIVLFCFSTAVSEISYVNLYAEQGTEVINTNGIKITITENPTEEDYLSSRRIVIPILIENTSDYNIIIHIDNYSINDWAIDGDVIEQLPSGKKKKSTISINLEDTDVLSIKECDKFEFSVKINDEYDQSCAIVSNQHIPITLYNVFDCKELDEWKQKPDPHLINILKTGSTTYEKPVSKTEFDPTLLQWVENTITLPESQWNKVKSVYCNIFYSYPVNDKYDMLLQIGRTCDYTITGDTLTAQFTGKVLSIDGYNIIAYYHLFTDTDKGVVYGYAPVMVNRKPGYMLITSSMDDKDYQYIGVTYKKPNIEDVANPNDLNGNLRPINEGDDMLSLSITYVNEPLLESNFIKLMGSSYIITNHSSVVGSTITDLSKVKIVYSFIDNDGNEYWTPLLLDWK